MLIPSPSLSPIQINVLTTVAFLLLLAFSSTAGLLPHSSLPSTPSRIQPYIPPQSDKALHFLLFFCLTLTFFFILDTTRKRILHLTLFTCPLLLGIGSEVVQGLLPNGRDWDPYDVLANVLGSLLAIAVANWFHRRAAERRRLAKYDALTQVDGEEDIELGGTTLVNGDLEVGLAGQESGITTRTDSLGALPKTVEEELDNWDENAEDEDAWSDDGGKPEDKVTPATSSRDSQEEPLTSVGTAKVAVD
jgi:VanZ family protein